MCLDKIKKAIEDYQKHLSQHVMDDGRMRWEYYGVTRKISQAACNYGGYIITGTRHYCPIMCMQLDAIGSEILEKWSGGHEFIVQGFTDQYGFFLDRKEAYLVAKEANQILARHEWGDTLYSESYI